MAIRGVWFMTEQVGIDSFSKVEQIFDVAFPPSRYFGLIGNARHFGLRNLLLAGVLWSLDIEGGPTLVGWVRRPILTTSSRYC